jgi:hypothetical protein
MAPQSWALIPGREPGFCAPCHAAIGSQGGNLPETKGNSAEANSLEKVGLWILLANLTTPGDGVEPTVSSRRSFQCIQALGQHPGCLVFYHWHLMVYNTGAAWMCSLIWSSVAVHPWGLKLIRATDVASAAVLLHSTLPLPFSVCLLVTSHSPPRAWKMLTAYLAQGTRWQAAPGSLWVFWN